MRSGATGDWVSLLKRRYAISEVVLTSERGLGKLERFVVVMVVAIVVTLEVTFVLWREWLTARFIGPQASVIG
jgi:hypothetical protein